LNIETHVVEIFKCVPAYANEICNLIDRLFVCKANEGRHIIILIRLRWLS
jgi:hypothetical protein